LSLSIIVNYLIDVICEPEPLEDIASHKPKGMLSDIAADYAKLAFDCYYSQNDYKR
jgi:hypothetical protein